MKPAQQKIIVRPLTRYEIENKLFRKYGADGNGGQILMVIPDPRPSRWHQRRKLRGIHEMVPLGFQLVPQYIIPALSQKDER